MRFFVVTALALSSSSAQQPERLRSFHNKVTRRTFDALVEDDSGEIRKHWNRVLQSSLLSIPGEQNDDGLSTLADDDDFAPGPLDDDEGIDEPRQTGKQGKAGKAGKSGKSMGKVGKVGVNGLGDGKLGGKSSSPTPGGTLDFESDDVLPPGKARKPGKSMGKVGKIGKSGVESGKAGGKSAGPTQEGAVGLESNDVLPAGDAGTPGKSASKAGKVGSSGLGGGKTGGKSAGPTPGETVGLENDDVLPPGKAGTSGKSASKAGKASSLLGLDDDDSVAGGLSGKSGKVGQTGKETGKASKAVPTLSPSAAVPAVNDGPLVLDDTNDTIGNGGKSGKGKSSGRRQRKI